MGKVETLRFFGLCSEWNFRDQYWRAKRAFWKLQEEVGKRGEVELGVARAMW